MTTTAERTVRDFMKDPAAYFDYSVTKAHSIAPDELQELQLTAMRLRFDEQREAIEMVRRQADRKGVEKIDTFDDIVPMLFAHSIYKSYPSSFLDDKRFDLLTRWLDRLTPYDLSAIDVSGCEDIDGWIDVIDEQTPLQPITSSGTTGTLSIIPKDKYGAEYTMRLWRMTFFQTFGKEPTPEDLDPNVHVIWPNYSNGKLGHLRMGPLLREYFTGGDASKFHALYEDSVSTDLMYLAAKMQAAASRGELDRLEIPPRLLAKREEFQRLVAERPQRISAFFEKLTTELAGERIFIMSAAPLMYMVAQEGKARGVKGAFAPDSVIFSGGGTKGFSLPDDWLQQVQEVLGVERVMMGYGMSEVSALHIRCDHERYHVQPWIVPYVLDPDTNEPLPRTGVQTGRAAFFDLWNTSHWGGSISGDEIELAFDVPCGCGQTSAHIADNIQRYSEKRGGDDKITCSATAEIHDEAMNFIREFAG